MNLQWELDSPVDDDIGNVDCLILGVGGSGDFRELKDFFGNIKYERDRLMQMINFLPDHFLTLEELVWH